MKDVTVDGVAVTNDVSRRYLPNHRLGAAGAKSIRSWVRGQFQPQDLAAIVMPYQATRRSGNEDCSGPRIGHHAMPSA